VLISERGLTHICSVSSFPLQGATEVFVHSHVLCFLNHGCDGRSNLSYSLTITEATADPDAVPEEVRIQPFRLEDEYNPAAGRYSQAIARAAPLRDIKRGEELFINYLAVAGEDCWAEDVPSLKAQCKGGLGPVREYEVAND
jgi:hypothetical protein